MKLWPQFLRIPFVGRNAPYDPDGEAQNRAYFSKEMLNDTAFNDAYQGELDSLVDAMLKMNTDTGRGERALIRIQRRARELQNLIQHLQTFASRGEVLKIKREKEAQKKAA